MKLRWKLSAAFRTTLKVTQDHMAHDHAKGYAHLHSHYYVTASFSPAASSDAECTILTMKHACRDAKMHYSNIIVVVIY